MDVAWKTDWGYGKWSSSIPYSVNLTISENNSLEWGYSLKAMEKHHESQDSLICGIQMTLYLIAYLYVWCRVESIKSWDCDLVQLLREMTLRKLM